MKLKKATEILREIPKLEIGDIIECDNSICFIKEEGCIGQIDFMPGSSIITLQGEFTREQLKALAVYMEEAKLFEDV